MLKVKNNNLKEITDELASLASNPSEHTLGLSPDMFLSEELATAELEQIFYKEWSCIGREDDIPNIGDFVTFKIGDQPIIVVRSADGSIRAMSNICRHRMMTVAEGHGNTRQFSCPYHGWTYSLEGSLVGAPHMTCSKNFDKEELSLRVLRCEIWHGWIYVSLMDEITSVADRLEQLEAIVQPYEMEHYVTVFVEDWEWNTNWKILCQNFMEGYHLPVAHRSTVGRNFPIEQTIFDSDGASEWFTYQCFLKPNDMAFGIAHPMNQRLIGPSRRTSVMPTVFPSHMYVLAPDHLWYLSLQPDGVGKVRMRYGAALAPEVIQYAENERTLVDEFKQLLDKTQEEDRLLVESIFENAKAPVSIAGPLSWLEREVHEFTQYLARKLA